MKTSRPKHFVLWFAFFTLACVPTASAFYNPTAGRWISRDPILEANDVDFPGPVHNAPSTIEHMYESVHNDFIDFVDVDGREVAALNASPLPLRLTISSVKPPKATSDCGGAESEVKFSLQNATGKNGWLIQHVVYDIKVTDCQGKRIPGKYGRGEYWEAWQVVNGTIYAGMAPIGGGVGVLHSGDFFSLPDQGPDRKGTIKKAGYIDFFENYNLTKPPWGALPQAGGLPTLETEPFPWADSGMLFHDLAVKFDCCCRPYAKPSVTGMPWW